MSKGKKNAKVSSDASGGWDEALVKDEVADSSWNYFLLLVVPQHPYADDHVQILKQAISRGERKKFFVFDREAILQKASEDLKTAASAGRGGGGGKSKMGSVMQDRPLYAEVCEHIVNAISSGEGVPVPLLARFVKYCLIKKKNADMNLEALKKEAAAQSTDAKSVKKGAGGAGKSAKKGKATPAIEEDTIPLPQKPPTTMKKRGEEEDDVKYIGDEPEDGPQSYVILTGFTDAELVQELISINVNVHSVVRFLSETISKELSEEESSKFASQSDCLLRFWSLLSDMCSSDKRLQNVALVDISASRSAVLTTEEDKGLYGTEIFDILALKVYELLALRTQYKHYMSFLNILNVPFITSMQASIVSSDRAQDVDNKEKNGSHPPSAAEKPSISRDLRYYNQLMSLVPEESTDIGLILHCLVEQVSLNVQSSTSSKYALAKSEQGSNAKLQEKLNTLIAELALTSADKQVLFTPIASSTNVSTQAQPVMSSRDVLKQKLYHLRSTNAFDIHSSSTHALETLWLKKQLLLIRQQVRDYSLDNSAINSLENFCTTQDIPQSLLQDALTSLSLEYMHVPNASAPPGYSMELKNFVFDHPFSLQLKDNEICTEVLEPSVFLSVEPYSVQEFMDDSAVVQQLTAHLLTTHPYLNCFHHKHLKSGVIVAHTGYDGKPLHQYSWLAQSHFPLGFQDYIQYVSKTFGNEVDKAIMVEAERAEIARDNAIQLQPKEAAQQELPSDSPLQKSAKMSASGKKSKTEASVASSKDLSEPPCVEQETLKLFNAYDLDGAPFLCKGLVRTAYTADGSQIRTETQQFISKSVTLSTTVLDGANRIAIYLVSGSAQKEKAQKVSKNTEQTAQDDASKTEAPTPLPPPPVLLSTIPKPIDNVIFCGLQASFKDSLILSLSHFGPDGNGEFSLKPDLPKVLRDANSATSSRPQSQATPPPPQKLSKKQLEQQQQLLEDQKRLEEQRRKAQIEYAEKWNSLVTQCKYQQLYASNSGGLHVNCQVFSDPRSDPTCTDGHDGHVVIRQSYHCKGSGTQDCEQVLLQAAYQEHHRCYLSNGSIISFMDQSILIQNADGSSLRTANIHEHEQYMKLSSAHSRIKSSQPQELSDRMKSATSAISFVSDVTRGDDIPMDKSLWIVTAAAGERFFWKDTLSSVKVEDVKGGENGPDDSSNETASKLSVIRLNPIRACRATDPITKEEIVTREDDVIILYQPDGSFISEFPDGTRITTTMKENGAIPVEIIVECPGYARVQYTSANMCTVTFPDLSVIECEAEGSYCIRKTDSYKLQINKNGDASYINLTQSEKQKYTFSHSGTVDLLQYCDSKRNNFNVDLSGKISMSNEGISIPTHSNFLPLYCWLPSDAPPYLLLPESSLQRVMSQAKTDMGSVLIKDMNPCGSLSPSTTLIKPCLFGLLQNYQVPYIRDTLLPANVHGSQIMSAKTISPCKALQYQHFACRVPMSKTVKWKVMAGIAKYISWRDKQEIASNSLLPNMAKDDDEIKNAKGLESKWKDAIPFVLLSTETLADKYKESIVSKPIPKSESLEIAIPKPQKRNSEQIDDVRKVLRQNKHPPYFSLHKLEDVQTTQPQTSNANKNNMKNPAEVAKCLLPSISLGYDICDVVVHQNNKQPGSKSKQKSIACETATRKTELGQKGLQLFPEVVNFGAIVEAGIYSQTVSVRNNGTKPARLKVKPPHGSIEMKLIYAPGPIAAGMSRSITIEIVVPENHNTIQDDLNLEISSEAGTILIPVKADILLGQ